MSKADAAMQHNADLATNALIWHLIVPCAIGIVVIGVLAIALEILKKIVSSQSKKFHAKVAKRKS